MKDRLLTLWVEQESNGSMTWSLIMDQAGRSAFCRHWTQNVDLDRVAEELDGLWRCIRRRVERNRDAPALEGHARMLFDLLVPLELKRTLRSDSGTLRVASHSVNLPWHALHDGEHFLGLRWAIGVLQGGGVHTEPNRAEPRMLVVSDPAEDLPAARHEGEAVVQTVASQGDSIGCDLRLGRLRKNDFLRSLTKYQLVHFAGHAQNDGDQNGWLFVDGCLTESDVLSSRGRQMPRLVFANACQSSGTAVRAAFLGGGTEHFLGTRVKLPDLTGADFATGFYKRLYDGMSIGGALRETRLDAHRKGDDTWMAYALDGDPSTVYFQAKPLHALEIGVRACGSLAIRLDLPPSDAESYAAKFENMRDRIRQLVLAHGGRVLPGRARIMRAVFGIPISFENDVARAAHTALALIREEPALTIAMGHGGLAASGVDVIGPSLHAAEKAVSNVRPGVYLLPAAQRALGRLADTEATDIQTDLVRLVDIIEMEPGTDAPLIGRDSELERLDRLEAVGRERGEGRGCIIVGPAGMGKTHLASAFASRIHGSRRCFHGRAASYRDEAFTPFAEILRDAVAIDVDETPERARSKLTLFLKDLDDRADSGSGPLDVVSIDHLLDDKLEGPSLVDGAEALMALMGYPVPGDGKTSHEIASAFLALLKALSIRESICLVLEDIHWLPSAGQTVINELVSWGRDDDFFLLMTARPGVLQGIEKWGRLPHIHRMDLSPLKRGASEELIRQLQPQIEGSDLTQLVARAEGNPLYLRELAMAAVDATNDELPATIEGVIQARADRISSEDREVLQVAAVIGREFAIQGVERLVQQPDLVLDALNRLEKKRFIRRRVASDESGFVFEHGLLHEVVYRGISVQSRRAWHGRAALWLDQEVNSKRHTDQTRIARHFASAGDLKRAADAWLDAGRACEEASAFGEARFAFEEALRLNEQHPLLLDHGGEAEALSAIGQLAFAAGELERADVAQEHAIELTSKEETLLCARRMELRARILEARGQVIRARDLVAEVLRMIAEDRSDEADLMRLTVERYGAWLMYRDGDLAGAAHAFQNLMLKTRDVDDGLHGLVLNGRGVAAYGQGEYGDAESYFRQALRLFETTRDRRRMCSAYNNLGMLAAKQGDPMSAAAWYEKALRVHAKSGHRTGLAQTYNNLGSLYGELGEYSRAEGFLRESIRIREVSGHSGLAIGYANLGEVLLKRGDLDASAEYLTRAIQLCRQGRGPQYLLPDAWRSLAEVRIAEGNFSDANHAISEAETSAEQANDGPGKAVCKRVRGVLARSEGNFEQARILLEGAIHALEAFDQPLELARAHWEMAKVCLEEDPDLSKTHRDTARLLFGNAGAQVPEFA